MRDEIELRWMDGSGWDQNEGRAIQEAHLFHSFSLDPSPLSLLTNSHLFHCILHSCSPKFNILLLLDHLLPFFACRCWFWCESNEIIASTLRCLLSTYEMECSKVHECQAEQSASHVGFHTVATVCSVLFGIDSMYRICIWRQVNVWCFLHQATSLIKLWIICQWQRTTLHLGISLPKVPTLQHPLQEKNE